MELRENQRRDIQFPNRPGPDVTMASSPKQKENCRETYCGIRRLKWDMDHAEDRAAAPVRADPVRVQEGNIPKILHIWYNDINL